MRADRAHPREIDDLDALWDALNQEPRSARRTPETAEDEYAQTIALLESLAAHEPDTAAHDRVRARFATLTGKDASVLPAHAPAPLSSDVRSCPRFKAATIRQLSNASGFGRLAAAVLLLVMLTSAVLIGPGRGMLPNGVQHQLAALPGFETSTSQQKPQGDRSLMSIRLLPGESSTGQIEVGLWRVTIGPGTTLTVPDDLQHLGPDPVAQFVESGSLTLSGQGKEFLATAERNFGVQALEAYRNDSPVSVTMLLLAPVGENGSFPLVVSTNSNQATSNPASGVEATLLGTNTISADDGHQIRVTLNTMHYVGMLDQHHDRAGSPAYALIETGEITVNRAATNGTPSSSEVYGAGKTIRLDGNRRLNATFTDTGSDPLSGFMVETAPMSDNPTLDQTQQAAAPFFIHWTVPESGDVTLTLRTITILPGGTYAMPTDAGVSYAVLDGSVDLSMDGADATTIGSGAVVGQEPGTTLAFTNASGEPVHMIQGVVSASDDVTNWPGEQSTDAEAQIVVTGRETLPSGPATIMLQQQAYGGDDGARQVSQGGNGLTLAIVGEGTINVSRVGGDVQIVPADASSVTNTAVNGTPMVSQERSAAAMGTAEALPPLGKNLPLSAGNGFMLAHPGGGWSMSGHGDEPSIGIALTISPSGAESATPVAEVATPATDGPTITLRGDAAACSIAPLTPTRLDQVMATPIAATSPLARSLKDQPGGTADIATTDAITGTLQSYVDCMASGDYTRMYAFYSDQAIRENETIRDLVERDWQVGEQPIQASVEDIVRFPDGRAGARTVIGGEVAYLTFVQEDGVWKIDVWDDRNN